MKTITCCSVDRLAELRRQEKSRWPWAMSTGGNLRRCRSSMMGTVTFGHKPSPVITESFATNSSVSSRRCNSDPILLSTTQ